MNPESLNCPNCGAAVSSDSVQCRFCKSRLKTVACAACCETMFLGSKFCSSCGAAAGPVEVQERQTAGNCPRCKRRLAAITIDSTLIDECSSCGGFWTTVETFEAICADREKQASILGFIRAHPHANASVPIVYVPCPVCGNLMNRSNFARASGVIIDTCKMHGVWFDADELPKIIDFIEKGGLSLAREKERLALEAERSRLRDEQRRQVAQDRRFGIRTHDDDNGNSLKDFIRKLFE